MLLEKVGTNIGSLCSIKVADIRDLIYTPDIVNGVAMGEVVFADGKTWQELYFTRDSAHWVEVTEELCPPFGLKVKWTVPKDSAATLGYFLKAQETRFVALLTDSNDTKTLAGTKDEPCKLGYSMRDKGQNARDSNMYTAEIQIRRNSPAAIYPY